MKRDELTANALRLIREQEGIDQPFEWPGGDSGVTIGYGYDLGYEEHLAEDCGGLLSEETIRRLATAKGKRGADALAATRSFRDIRIGIDAAEKVFVRRSVPRYLALCRSAMPGFDELPPDVQGALFSLIYNRGAGMKDINPSKQDRREMREIRDAVAQYAHSRDTEQLHRVAGQLRSMERLWRGKGLDGLIARREAEARLVESAIPTQTEVR